MADLPRIDLLGYSIAEPTTFVTDIVVGVLSLAAAWRLGAVEGRAAGLWRLSFIALAVCFFCGAMDHGLIDYIEKDGLVWRVSLACSALAAGFGGAGVGQAMVGPTRRRPLVVAFAFFGAAYVVFMFSGIEIGSTRSDAFVWLPAYYVPAYVTILLVARSFWKRTGESAGRWISSGVALTLAGGAWQLSGIGFDENFNHNDIFHCIQMVAVVSLAIGASRLRDLDPGD